MIEDEPLTEFLTHNVENIYPSYNEVAALLRSGKKLRMYFGIDPTGPMHLGHTIPLSKLSEFQQLGHTAILLIGTFTATVGDPSGKTTARVPLSPEQVHSNMAGYLENAAKFIDFHGPNPAEVRYNHEWLQGLTLSEVVKLAGHITVQQMLERDLFQKRLKEGNPIFIHEFLYPLMQGYDSLALDVDGEVGGSDQTFNMLTGRTLARQISGKEKFVLTTKLITDPSGKKMGKSEGNTLTLAEDAPNMYGKMMSWPDSMILPGFELCTALPKAEIVDIAAALNRGENPMLHKMHLALEITKFFHGAAAAAAAQKDFILAHRDKEVPENIPALAMTEPRALSEVLLSQGIVESKAEFKRLIQEGAIHFENQKVADFNFRLTKSGVLKIGKYKFLKITFE